MGGTTDNYQENLPVIADRSETFTLVREWHAGQVGSFHDGKGGILGGKWGM